MIDFSVSFESNEVTKATHAKLMKMLNRQVMIRHALRNLPKHFENVPETSPGVGGYQYKKRGKKYTDRKERQFKHRKPNVLTGALRQAVLQRVKVTATQYHGTLHFRGTPEHKLADWQRGELEAVSGREYRESVRWQEKEYNRLAQTDQYRRKRKKRIR